MLLSFPKMSGRNRYSAYCFAVWPSCGGAPMFCKERIALNAFSPVKSVWDLVATIGFDCGGCGGGAGAGAGAEALGRTPLGISG